MFLPEIAAESTASAASRSASSAPKTPVSPQPGAPKAPVYGSQDAVRQRGGGGEANTIPNKADGEATTTEAVSKKGWAHSMFGAPKPAQEIPKEFYQQTGKINAAAVDPKLKPNDWFAAAAKLKQEMDGLDNQKQAAELQLNINRPILAQLKSELAAGELQAKPGTQMTAEELQSHETRIASLSSKIDQLDAEIIQGTKLKEQLSERHTEFKNHAKATRSSVTSTLRYFFPKSGPGAGWEQHAGSIIFGAMGIASIPLMIQGFAQMGQSHKAQQAPPDPNAQLTAESPLSGGAAQYASAPQYGAAAPQQYAAAAQQYAAPTQMDPSLTGGAQYASLGQQPAYAGLGQSAYAPAASYPSTTISPTTAASQYGNLPVVAPAYAPAAQAQTGYGAASYGAGAGTTAAAQPQVVGYRVVPLAPTVQSPMPTMPADIPAYG